MSKLNVSVIVVNYNCMTTLKYSVETILRSKGVEELLLVDNASTDKSLESISESMDNRLKIIRMKKNIGLTAARNLAASKTTCNFMAFTDADIAVDPNWLEYPCSLLKRHREFGAVQCNIVLIKNIDDIACSLMKPGALHLKDFSKEQTNSFYRILFPIGAAFVIRRDVWNSIGGFDPSLFIGNDDVDFGIRLWLSGYEVINSCEGTVYHKFGTLRSQKNISSIFQFYGLRNMLIIWTKDLQGKTILTKVLPFALFYPFLALRYGGLIGFKGILSFLGNFPLILNRRYKVQQLRKIFDAKITPMMHRTGTLPIDLIINNIRFLFQHIFKRK